MTTVKNALIFPITERKYAVGVYLINSAGQRVPVARPRGKRIKEMVVCRVARNNPGSTTN
jgi:hypothetical protein